MYKRLFILILLLGWGTLYAQTRCFRFALVLGNNNDWRDTSCIACTSDPAVLADVDQQLSLPFSQRNKMINGDIAAGNAGVNQNGSHQFRWHFIPGRWRLAEVSVEVCDGRPMTDVDADTSYWLHTLGFFCPWTSLVSSEISVTNVQDPEHRLELFSFYPNPAVSTVRIIAGNNVQGILEIAGMDGRVYLRRDVQLEPGSVVPLDISFLAPGGYLLRLTEGDRSYTRRLLKQ